MAESTQNWQPILQAARALTAAEQTLFARISVYEWIWRRYSRAEHGRRASTPTFRDTISNATGGPPSACGNLSSGLTVATISSPTNHQADRGTYTAVGLNLSSWAVDSRGST